MQGTTGEDTADWKRLMVCRSDLRIVEFSSDAVIACSAQLCVQVVSKSNIQSETPSRVTHTRDGTLVNEGV
jgi:hypothetical protein